MNTHRGTTPFSVLTILLLSLNGCIDISAQLQPINELAKAEKTYRDCAGIAFGFGFGDLSVERAMIKVKRIHDPLGLNPSQPSSDEKVSAITKIRSIALRDSYFLGFGERCIEVTGE